MVKAPERGDLVYLNFNPQLGHEQNGRRPGIILSPKNFNEATGFAIVCPITRQQKGYPFEVVLPEDMAITGVVLTDQVRSLDWRARRTQIEGHAPESIINTCIELIHSFLAMDF